MQKNYRTVHFTNIRLTENQLLRRGWTKKEINAGKHLPTVSGAASNSTQILTDLQSAVNNAPYSATAQAAASAPAGPIEDLPGMIKNLLLSAQEMAAKLNYILGGSQLTAANQSAPTGGLITSGADSATYNLLVGIYQILK